MFLHFSAGIDGHEIVSDIEDAYNKYIKFDLTSFICLVCKEKHDGTFQGAKNHLKFRHKHISIGLSNYAEKTMRNIFTFDKTARTFICPLCSNQFRGSMFNAKDHLASRHKEVAFKLGLIEDVENGRRMKRDKQKNNDLTWIN